MSELPKVCPECGASNLACVRMQGTGWICTCSECKNDWIVVDSALSVSAAMVVLWLFVCLAVFVSVAALKKGGV